MPDTVRNAVPTLLPGMQKALGAPDPLYGIPPLADYLINFNGGMVIKNHPPFFRLWGKNGN